MERGRWAVYLDVTMWDEAGRSDPLRAIRRRITDYSTRSQAEVAAKWMERAAERDLPHPPAAGELPVPSRKLLTSRATAGVDRAVCPFFNKFLDETASSIRAQRTRSAACGSETTQLEADVRVIACRPQPAGIFPFPAGLLVLPSLARRENEALGPPARRRCGQRTAARVELLRRRRRRGSCPSAGGARRQRGSDIPIQPVRAAPVAGGLRGTEIESQRRAAGVAGRSRFRGRLPG